MKFNNLLLFGISALLSWLFISVIIPTLRQRLLDTPNSRSSHQVPTPRGGGLAFVVIGSIVHVLSSTEITRWIPILCIPLAFVGLIDDRKDIPAIWRYMVQIITAVFLVAVGNLDMPLLLIIFMTFALTAIINFTNFMDGLDGLLAGCGVLLMGACSAWALSGAIFGFLLWNWSPAKVFMGDVGSTFIGAVFGGLIMQQQTLDSLLTTALIGLPLFGDAFVCVLRRLCNGERVFQAHRKHLFQRLNQAGWSHRTVASLYISCVAVLLLARNTGNMSIFTFVLIGEVGLAVFLDQKVAAKFRAQN
jgi:Fuc2NAc and GlcNAc transferase